MFSLVVVALVSGWQLGRRRSVRQVENESLVAYQSWSIYRDSAYNESGFRDWEASAIAAYFPKSGRVLVPSCGGGREVLALARRGFEVVAFECEPSLSFIVRICWRSMKFLLRFSRHPPAKSQWKFEECVLTLP